MRSRHTIMLSGHLKNGVGPGIRLYCLSTSRTVSIPTNPGAEYTCEVLYTTTASFLLTLSMIYILLKGGWNAWLQAGGQLRPRPR